MRWCIFIIIILCSCIKTNASVEAESLARFFAGLIVMRHDPFLTENERAIGYRELEKISGVTSKEAVEYLRSIKGNPGKWSEIQEKITRIILERDKKEKN